MKNINSSKRSSLFLTVLFLLISCSQEGRYPVEDSQRTASLQADQRTHIIWCSLSPSGQEVIFVKVGKDCEKNGVTEIWKINVDGTNLTQLTKNSVDTTPEWSPDGNKIIFVSWRPEMHLWVMKKDGTEKRQLTRGKQLKYSLVPQWSPRGDKIAFICTTGERKPLWIINADGMEPIKIIDNVPCPLGWSWSSDGNELLYSSAKGDIWSITADAKHKKFICSIDNFCMELRPSPSGNMLMYTASISSTKDEVGIIHMSGTQQHGERLILQGNFGTPRWIPNEEAVIVSKRVVEGKDHYFHLCMVNLSSGITTELTTGKVHDSFISCLPNGKEILFVRDSKSIMIMNTDGSNQRQIFPKE